MLYIAIVVSMILTNDSRILLIKLKTDWTLWFVLYVNAVSQVEKFTYPTYQIRFLIKNSHIHFRINTFLIGFITRHW